MSGVLTEETIRQGFAAAKEGLNLRSLATVSWILLAEMIYQYSPVLISVWDLIRNRWSTWMFIKWNDIHLGSMRVKVSLKKIWRRLKLMKNNIRYFKMTLE